MSLFIVNFHWQTYSCNISFQAQRLERLRKERQNQIKCKNIQWKDRNTSYSGKRKYLLFSCCFLFLPLMATTFAVCNFSPGVSRHRGNANSLCCPGVPATLSTGVIKQRRAKGVGQAAWPGVVGGCFGFCTLWCVCHPGQDRALRWGGDRAALQALLRLPSLFQQHLAHWLGWRIL